MKALILTREYPPHVYGGAGVHVEYLSRELAKRIGVEVRCFGDQDESAARLAVRGYTAPKDLVGRAPEELRSPLQALATGIGFADAGCDADVVHCHTWYAHFGGILFKILYGRPLVVSIHSLEPLRPWKREQLGRGYDLSCWIERTTLEMADSVIAVSEETRRDVATHFPGVSPSRVSVIPNGIDVDVYRPVEETDVLDSLAIPRDLAYVLFVGRITRQKGLAHLLRAAEALPAEVGLVLCAGAPDTEDIARETEASVARLQQRRSHVYWIREMVSRRAAIQLYSHAAVFCCPSIYEPFGIINLEAMACRTPVVASAVGGIKDVVRDGETGFLVSFAPSQEPPFEPLEPEAFAADLAAALVDVLKDDARRRRMGEAGRRRAERDYSWGAVAEKTQALYQRLADASV